ncbi:MAG: hypothetical protein IPI63_00250 [Methanothrix sp.]|jgi:hypothetical protein|uniref:hypothetical protein n=1 Tax=Methanothrix sp. TaxID=90426 RepID=UPI0025E1B039|nr:hypothetical protein [Methanothrix sp.]MBK7385228.1 hypothetical protein [Methanothrix sp.]
MGTIKGMLPIQRACPSFALPSDRSILLRQAQKMLEQEIGIRPVLADDQKIIKIKNY